MTTTRWWTRLLRRPELGALSGTILVFVFFGIVAGDSGLFSPPVLEEEFARLLAAGARLELPGHTTA